MDTGEEFQYESTYGGTDWVIIKPIEAEEIEVDYIYNDEKSDEPSGIVIDLPGITSNQKAFISSAIKSLMEVIQLEDKDLDFVKYPPTHLINMIVEAREALRDGGL